MANTYTLIEAKTLGSTTATVTFTSIPQTYTDLKLLVSSRSTLSANYNYLTVNFNGASTNWNYKVLYAVGSSAESASSNATFIEYIWQPAANVTANSFGNIELYIPNYTSANYKSVSADFVSENNGTTGFILGLNAALWPNTAAITSITLGADGASLLSGSSFYLYGIKNS
jgi:hypothetical protein